MSVREQLKGPVPTEYAPTRFHSDQQVRIWHARRVVADSATYQEAAARLNITTKTLWDWRRAHPEFHERPGDAWL